MYKQNRYQSSITIYYRKQPENILNCAGAIDGIIMYNVIQ